jgi:hypothetical protein
VVVEKFRVEAGDLFASGRFELADQSIASTVARWDGTDWHVLGSGGNDGAFAFHGGYLYAAGTGVVHGHASHGLSRLPLPVALDVRDHNAPLRNLLLVASPNPGRGGTTLSFSLHAGGRARLAIHDVSGRRVAVLFDGPATAGDHHVRWSDPAPPGIYFARLDAPGGAMRVTRVVRLD